MLANIPPSIILPISVAFGVPLVTKFVNLFGRDSADQDAKNGIYRYSKGAIAFMQLSIILWEAMFFLVFWPIRDILNGSWADSLSLAQISFVVIAQPGCAFLLLILWLYVERFTIKLEDQILTISAFGSRIIRYSDITNIAVERRARGASRLRIDLLKSNDITIPDSLPKFDELVIDLRQHVEESKIHLATTKPINPECLS